MHLPDVVVVYQRIAPAQNLRQTANRVATKPATEAGTLTATKASMSKSRIGLRSPYLCKTASFVLTLVTGCMFHCHVLEHAERGMMGELEVLQ